MTLDRYWFQVLSELFINLSAGWLGAAAILPIIQTRPRPVNLGLLLTNLTFAIVYLVLAYHLHKLSWQPN